ncbi:aldehyde dehydrogenase family protein [Rossellomorea aquimaris]|uniref:Aldehyde dehydrogenase family protein n=1 Tax=Rossellomorea aquimaris TaxID=189382 RepID=A0A5D4TL81_9BACI|nr:aldehyde dehydrogenase family protein [Rossellomorea aquimaris]TYS75551.1 aldehyde dehydrogenase family protein [Rossellomorea aquimaris]
MRDIKEPFSISRRFISFFTKNTSVFSTDLNKARKAAGRLQTGNCMINDIISNMQLPFMGVKESGFSRYHEKEGFYAFCNIKSRMLHKGKRNKEVNWFPYKQNTADWLKKALTWKYK